ncbi:unnamed protein product, partial [Larinioides sclopetarius]
MTTGKVINDQCFFSGHPWNIHEEIPFVLKTFDLSIDYSLSDSERQNDDNHSYFRAKFSFSQCK